jgi:sporulation protein YlmC with PRC-barrel domain
MLNKAETLQGYSLQNIDAETIGKVKEFYFDDRHWTNRYLVADTGNWLTGRQVLISPHALGAVKSGHENIVLDLTKKQIEDSPSLDSDKPVSRQFEQSYFVYYGYPVYWGGPYMWGAHPLIMRDPEQWKKTIQGEKEWDPNLRNTQDVRGYQIQASDGEIGHVEDFIIDDETWAIRYLIIDTKNWWSGKKVLIAPSRIERVSWAESKVFVNLPRDTIKQALEYSDKSLLTRVYEIELHRHYNRQGYWADEPATPKDPPSEEKTRKIEP